MVSGNYLGLPETINSDARGTRVMKVNSLARIYVWRCNGGDSHYGKLLYYRTCGSLLTRQCLPRPASDRRCSLSGVAYSLRLALFHIDY